MFNRIRPSDIDTEQVLNAIDELGFQSDNAVRSSIVLSWIVADTLPMVAMKASSTERR